MPSRTNRIRNRRAVDNDDDASDDFHNEKKPSSSLSTTPKPSPLRLKKLLLLLFLTTLALLSYHVFRLHAKGKGLLSSRLGQSAVHKVSDSIGIPGLPSLQQQQEDSNVPGGILVRPSSESSEEQQKSDEDKIKLEDLDMDTLQAAFDALYGDGGPLGPKRGRGGEDGQYSHVFRKKGE